MDLDIVPSSIPMAPMGMLQPLRAPSSLRFSSATPSITFAEENQCIILKISAALLLLVFSAAVISPASAGTLTVFAGPGCAGETEEIDYICGCVSISEFFYRGSGCSGEFFSSTGPRVSATIMATRVSSSSVHLRECLLLLLLRECLLLRDTNADLQRLRARVPVGRPYSALRPLRSTSAIYPEKTIPAPPESHCRRRHGSLLLSTKGKNL